MIAFMNFQFKNIIKIDLYVLHSCCRTEKKACVIEAYITDHSMLHANAFDQARLVYSTMYQDVCLDYADN